MCRYPQKILKAPPPLLLYELNMESKRWAKGWREQDDDALMENHNATAELIHLYVRIFPCVLWGINLRRVSSSAENPVSFGTRKESSPFVLSRGLVVIWLPWLTILCSIVIHKLTITIGESKYFSFYSHCLFPVHTLSLCVFAVVLVLRG